MEEKTGTILTVSSEKMTGTLKDSNGGGEYDFMNPTVVDIEMNKSAIYILVQNPGTGIKKAIITRK